MKAHNDRAIDQCGACRFEAMTFDVVMSASAHAENCSHYQPPTVRGFDPADPRQHDHQTIDGAVVPADPLACQAGCIPMEMVELAASASNAVGRCGGSVDALDIACGLLDHEAVAHSGLIPAEDV